MSAWAHADGSGLACDSSGGVVLTNGVRRAASAAWFRRSDIARLSDEEFDGFWRLCPAFVVELRSPWQKLPTLRGKMREWIDNGAQLGWMIDPENRTVEIYRPDREPEVQAGIDSITAGEPVSGFVLDLRPVWDPLGS